LADGWSTILVRSSAALAVHRTRIKNGTFARCVQRRRHALLSSPRRAEARPSSTASMNRTSYSSMRSTASSTSCRRPCQSGVATSRSPGLFFGPRDALPCHKHRSCSLACQCLAAYRAGCWFNGCWLLVFVRRASLLIVGSPDALNAVQEASEENLFVHSQQVFIREDCGMCSPFRLDLSVENLLIQHRWRLRN